MVHGHYLQSVIEEFPSARVLCIGDVMLDRFVYGAVDRVSAEAPIPILQVDSEKVMLGGAGNVARNVAALGAQAVLIAVTGDDPAATQIAELAVSGRLTSRLIVDASRPSSVKTRFIANGQQLLRADEETTEAISEETAEHLIAAIEADLSAADVMVLSDYLKGVLTDAVLAAAIAAARKADVPVIADPKRDDFSAYSGVSVLKPNVAELAAASRLPCSDGEQVEAAARQVMKESGVGAMLVSRSENGMSLVEKDRAALQLSVRALEVFDVSGAGDTVVATTAVALAAGAELCVAAELANVAGGIVVGKVGTAVVTRDELITGLLAAEVSSSEAKIVSAEVALAAVDRWRKHGLRVGLTNGCFDLLHPGHVSLLSEAKSSCDRLIVAMNSDASVKRLKGEDRPIQHETARAIVLASLGTVDLVVVFSDDTPIPLIDLLTPDVLVKGGDYSIDEVVGSNVVRGYGGEVKLASLVPGQSSADVIARISGSNPTPPSTTGSSGSSGNSNPAASNPEPRGAPIRPTS